jgi:NTE family protein
MTELGYTSKLNAEWTFLSMLKDEGRMIAEKFLGVHSDDLGHRPTIDLDVLLKQV